ncbi:hypothetical protein PENSPDRAFT_653674 [Peniophora sp. CONT]|nr:hypothetical protein PENSPDRAFT_653674 [Peniophora sp. CONT]
MIPAEEEGSSFSPDLTALTISVTCRTFRNIALSFSDLWTQINLLWDEPVIQLYLERAGTDSFVSVYHCAREAAGTVHNSDSSDDDEPATSGASEGSGSSVHSHHRSTSATSSHVSGYRSPSPAPSSLEAYKLTSELLSRVRSLQFDERKQSQNMHDIMMLIQTACREAQTLSALETFIFLCDDFRHLHFEGSTQFQGLKALRLSTCMLSTSSCLLASTITSLALHGVIFVGQGPNPTLLCAFAGLPLLRRLELKSISGLSNSFSTGDAALEMHHLQYFAMELEADSTLFLLENIRFPTNTELHCKFGGVNNMPADASLSERNESLPLRNRTTEILSAMRARYQPALNISGNSFTKISITSVGHFDGCRIALENPTNISPLALLPERVTLQLQDATAGPPFHVDLPKLIAHVVPLLPSPDSAYTTLVVGPVPWAREHAAWSNGLGAALSSITAAEVAGIAGEGLLAALQFNDANLFPHLSSLLIKHLAPTAMKERALAVQRKHPHLSIKLTGLLC